jgi:hypothetical protein
MSTTVLPLRVTQMEAPSSAEEVSREARDSRTDAKRSSQCPSTEAMMGFDRGDEMREEGREGDDIRGEKRHGSFLYVTPLKIAMPRLRGGGSMWRPSPRYPALTSLEEWEA